MNIKKIVAVGLCIFQIFFVSANTWKFNTAEVPFLSREDGKICEIYGVSNIDEDILQTISNTLTMIWSIPGLEGLESRVIVDDDYFLYTMYPKTFMYKDVDLNQYMPSGLTFRYESGLFYDVTLKVNEYLPRVTGAYVDTNDFLDQLYFVTVLPELSLQGDVLLQRIARLEATVLALAKKTLFSKYTDVSDDLLLAIVTIHNENPDITVSEAVKLLKEKGFKTNKKEVEAVFMVYLGIFAE